MRTAICCVLLLTGIELMVPSILTSTPIWRLAIGALLLGIFCGVVTEKAEGK